MPVSTFEAYDESSYFFGFMSRADATDLLSNKEPGTFLVRESTTAKGDLVLSVKESDKVSHYIIYRFTSEESQQVGYKIGEQIFADMPTLLTYYNHNNLDDSPLKVPVSKAEATEVPLSIERKLPGKAKVIQPRIPNAYDKTALTLKVGDVVTVTKANIDGCWEGEISGRKGHFPFNYVKFIEEPNK